MNEIPDHFPVVTLDGGAASGKSSTARGVCAALGFLHVDTGLHYRTLTRRLLEVLDDPCEAGEAAVVKALEAVTLGTRVEGREALLTLDDHGYEEDVLRSEMVTAATSRFAAMEPVRAKLRAYQRSMATFAREAGFPGLVMDGRDIGSVIFPGAPFRFYLEADAATRQARREAEGLADTVSARDRLDSSRKSAPLLVPEGAAVIDTGQLSLEEVVATIVRAVQGT